MPIQTSYTHARTNFAKFCNEVTANLEVVIISRNNNDDVALIAASELTSLTETAPLLRSPKNAKRLLTALKRAQARTMKPQTIKKLRQEVGLGKQK